MKLEPAVIECEQVEGRLIPKAVLLGDRRIEHIAEARALFDHHAPVAILLKIYVSEIRTIVVSPGCHLQSGGG